jgi:hypothetical protein
MLILNSWPTLCDQFMYNLPKKPFSNGSALPYGFGFFLDFFEKNTFFT